MAERLVEGRVARTTPRLRLPALDRAAGLSWPVVAFVAAMAVVAVAQAPVLGHYFFGDDFVPLADIASRSTGGYLKDLFLLRDDTPNWRFLTGVVYLVLYRSFGLDALPYLLTSVLLHVATAALLFWFVYRALDHAWPAFLAAAFFGTTAAHVPTAGQATALNNVLAAFLVMLALVLLYEGLQRGAGRWWLAGAVASFAAAVAANESSAVVAPVFALVLLWKSGASWSEPRSWLRPVLLSTPYLLLGSVAVAGFGACRCTESADLYTSGDHVITNVWLYLGRLLYPADMDAPGQVGTAHAIAGSAAIAVALVALARGPALARVSVVFLALALAPYLPNGLWSAPRYTYLAAIPFSVLAALLFREAGQYAERIAPAAVFSIAFVAMGVLGLYTWQSWSQNETFDDASARWEELVGGLRGSRIDPPPGSFVYVRGGPVTGFLDQCAALPAAGEVLWGDVKLFTFLAGDLEQYRVRPGYDVRVLDARGRALVPVEVRTLAPGEAAPSAGFLLPHVAPEATGNLCDPNVALAP